MKKEIELKPCPFCGGEAGIYDGYSCGGFQDSGEIIWEVGCSACGIFATTDMSRTKDDAIQSWNTRAYEKE